MHSIGCFYKALVLFALITSLMRFNLCTPCTFAIIFSLAGSRASCEHGLCEEYSFSGFSETSLSSGFKRGDDDSRLLVWQLHVPQPPQNLYSSFFALSIGRICLYVFFWRSERKKCFLEPPFLWSHSFWPSVNWVTLHSLASHSYYCTLPPNFC